MTHSKRLGKALAASPFARFIAACPEWFDEVDVARIDGEWQLIASANCTRAFINWAVERGAVTDRTRAAQFRDFITSIENGTARPVEAS